MNNEGLFTELERNAEVIRSLLSGVNEREYLWRPAPDKWNLLDVICHLYDEEIEDFRARAASILADPSKELVKIAPYNWPTEREYQKEQFEERITAFVAARTASVAWLRALDDPKWLNAFQHPKVGPVTAQLILENWVAHDYLHIRQILKIKYDYLGSGTNNPLDYAGDW
jgi:hypothetical protein